MVLALVNNCRFTPSAGGTGDWVYSSALSGYNTPAQANTIAGITYHAFAISADLTQWEISTGVCSGGTTFPRTTVLYNSSGTGTMPGQSGAGTKINFSVAPQVALIGSVEDIMSLPGGFVNKLRNSSLGCWFHGSGALTITTSGGWGAEGIYIVPTGASVTAQQSANGLANPLSVFSQKITGATSVTDVVTRFVIESYDAAPLAGQQVTFQIPVLNNTGGTITPTITVKHANSQDNFGATTTDVSAVSLQSIANGATGILAYSWAAPTGTVNGISINIDFGNNFSSNAKSIQIGGGFDCRVTNGIPTGLVSFPPNPEIRTVADDIEWCQRFYETTYENGVAPATATRVGMIDLGVTGDATNKYAGTSLFKVMKRADPTVSVWDGAGTANAGSRYINGAYGDGAFTGGNVLDTAQSGFKFYPNNAAGNSWLVHFAADATLTGA